MPAGGTFKDRYEMYIILKGFWYVKNTKIKEKLCKKENLKHKMSGSAFHSIMFNTQIKIYNCYSICTESQSHQTNRKF